MNRLTKIIATIGPACDTEDMIAKMIQAGTNVFRFNFKHNTVEWHDQMIERVNKVADKEGVRVGTLIDLQGPEIRIKLPVDEITLEENEKILLDEETLTSDIKGFSITHPDIIPYIDDDQRVVADDGEFEFVLKKENGKSWLISKSSGILKQRKTLNIPGADFPFPVLIERDFDGIKLAKKQEIDYVALSFVRSAEDIGVLRQEMKKLGVKAQIVSKVEAEKAIEDLDNIIEASDGIMVARGDLGVEMPLEQVPYYQKMMIKKCIEKGKFAITATQMLQSMIQSPIPTRAEVSDVANATYDLSDATMLSGEAASGKFPVRSVNVMRRTIEFNEKKFLSDSRLRFTYQLKGNPSIIAESAYDLYLESEQKEDIETVSAFVVFTETGNTARLISAYRPGAPVYAFCPNKKVADSLTLNYGVHALERGDKYEKKKEVTHNHVLAAIEYLKDHELIAVGQNLIVTHGDYWAIEGGSSTIKLIKVQ